MGNNPDLNRADPICPICKALKENHTPEQARNCFEKIRDKESNGQNQSLIDNKEKKKKNKAL